jgi:hypothetical protein
MRCGSQPCRVQVSGLEAAIALLSSSDADPKLSTLNPEAVAIVDKKREPTVALQPIVSQTEAWSSRPAAAAAAIAGETAGGCFDPPSHTEAHTESRRHRPEPEPERELNTRCDDWSAPNEAESVSVVLHAPDVCSGGAAFGMLEAERIAELNALIESDARGTAIARDRVLPPDSTAAVEPSSTSASGFSVLSPTASSAPGAANAAEASAALRAAKLEALRSAERHAAEVSQWPAKRRTS